MPLRKPRKRRAFADLKVNEPPPGWTPELDRQDEMYDLWTAYVAYRCLRGQPKSE